MLDARLVRRNWSYLDLPARLALARAARVSRSDPHLFERPQFAIAIGEIGFGKAKALLQGFKAGIFGARHRYIPESAHAGDRDVKRARCAEYFDVARNSAAAGLYNGPPGFGHCFVPCALCVLHGSHIYHSGSKRLQGENRARQRGRSRAGCLVQVAKG
jgi:hypothetical protein